MSVPPPITLIACWLISVPHFPAWYSRPLVSGTFGPQCAPSGTNQGVRYSTSKSLAVPQHNSSCNKYKSKDQVLGSGLTPPVTSLPRWVTVYCQGLELGGLKGHSKRVDKRRGRLIGVRMVDFDLSTMRTPGRLNWSCTKTVVIWNVEVDNLRLSKGNSALGAGGNLCRGVDPLFRCFLLIFPHTPNLTG